MEVAPCALDNAGTICGASMEGAPCEAKREISSCGAGREGASAIVLRERASHSSHCGGGFLKKLISTYINV